MDVQALEAQIKAFEEQNHFLAQNYKETTSALLDRVHQLEEELKASRPPPNSEPGPPMGTCQDCGEALTMEAAMTHTCRAKVPPKPQGQSHPLAEQARQLLQTDGLMAFKKLVAQGLPLDSYYPDSGMCEG